MKYWLERTRGVLRHVPAGDYLGLGGLVAAFGFAWSIKAGLVLGALFLVAYLWHVVTSALKRRTASRRAADVRHEISSLAQSEDLMGLVARQGGLRAPWRATLVCREGDYWVRLAQASNHGPFVCDDWATSPAESGPLGWASRLDSTDQLIIGDPGLFEEFLESRDLPSSFSSVLKFKAAAFAARVVKVASASDGYVDVGLQLESGDVDGVTVGILERVFPDSIITILFRVQRNQGLLDELIATLDESGLGRASGAAG